ncbi:uncharacterized protein [Apostichopus japonicus]|uniref:uncharacterized protein n=1 Tax=Stichopus japonicus TaxID=307972 RepID=UPI003AB198D9
MGTSDVCKENSCKKLGQSGFCEYHDEKKYKQVLELPWFGKNKDHRKQYNEFIYHETLRVAVCQMMEEKEKLPTELHHFNYKQIRTKLQEINVDQRAREEQPASEMDQTEAGMEQLTIEDEQATDVIEEQTADVKE